MLVASFKDLTVSFFFCNLPVIVRSGYVWVLLEILPRFLGMHPAPFPTIHKYQFEDKRQLDLLSCR